jgi:hypothetical protein
MSKHMQTYYDMEKRANLDLVQRRLAAAVSRVVEQWKKTR